MLVNPVFQEYNKDYWDNYIKNNPDEAEFITEFNQKMEMSKFPVQEGIFYSCTFNFSILCESKVEQFPILGEVFTFNDRCFGLLTPYGVCDNVEQVLSHYKDDLSNPSRKFFVSFTPVYREHQPERDGWRWHKWGKYIGDYEISHEYLYDEDIEMVLCFHIYEIKE